MGVVAIWLAEFLIKHGQPVRCIDGDPVNRSFGQYKAFAAEKLDLLNADGVLDRTRYDGLVERFLAENAVFVLDSGATAFLPFWSYLVEADLVATLRAAGRRVYVHVPIAGGWSKRRLYEGNTREQRVQVTAQPAPTAALTKITGLRLASPSMRCHLRFAMPREESKVWRMWYRDKDGVRQRESTLTEDWDEAQKRLRERLQARDNNTLPALRRGQDLKFGEWSDFYLENFSKPPFRAPKTHEVNQRALKHLRKMFENTKLAELTADDIEMYLRRRLKQRAVVKTKDGFVEKHVLKATTVHQELRVVRRMLNVAVRKKFLFANPCAGLELPARVDGLFRPHYMTWSEQQTIEFSAPEDGRPAEDCRIDIRYFS